MHWCGHLIMAGPHGPAVRTATVPLWLRAILERPFPPLFRVNSGGVLADTQGTAIAVSSLFRSQYESQSSRGFAGGGMPHGGRRRRVCGGPAKCGSAGPLGGFARPGRGPSARPCATQPNRYAGYGNRGNRQRSGEAKGGGRASGTRAFCFAKGSRAPFSGPGKRDIEGGDFASSRKLTSRGAAA